MSRLDILLNIRPRQIFDRTFVYVIFISGQAIAIPSKPCSIVFRLPTSQFHIEYQRHSAYFLAASGILRSQQSIRCSDVDGCRRINRRNWWWILKRRWSDRRIQPRVFDGGFDHLHRWYELSVRSKQCQCQQQSQQPESGITTFQNKIT